MPVLLALYRGMLLTFLLCSSWQSRYLLPFFISLFLLFLWWVQHGCLQMQTILRSCWTIVDGSLSAAHHHAHYYHGHNLLIHGIFIDFIYNVVIYQYKKKISKYARAFLTSSSHHCIWNIYAIKTKQSSLTQMVQWELQCYLDHTNPMLVLQILLNMLTIHELQVLKGTVEGAYDIRILRHCLYIWQAPCHQCVFVLLLQSLEQEQMVLRFRSSCDSQPIAGKS